MTIKSTTHEPYLPLPALTTRLQAYYSQIEKGYKFESAPDQLFIRELIKYANTEKCDPTVLQFVQNILEKIVATDDAQWLGHLINVGLNPNMSLKETNTESQKNTSSNILWLAVVQGAPDCVQELVNRKANMNLYEASGQINPLLYATQKGKKEIARILIQSNIHKQVFDKDSNTVPQIAIRLRSSEGDAIFKAFVKCLKTTVDPTILDSINKAGTDTFTDCLYLDRADCAELIISKLNNAAQAKRIYDLAQSHIEKLSPEAQTNSECVMIKLKEKTTALLEKKNLQTEVLAPSVMVGAERETVGQTARM